MIRLRKMETFFIFLFFSFIFPSVACLFWGEVKQQCENSHRHRRGTKVSIFSLLKRDHQSNFNVVFLSTSLIPESNIIKKRKDKNTKSRLICTLIGPNAFNAVVQRYSLFIFISHWNNVIIHTNATFVIQTNTT